MNHYKTIIPPFCFYVFLWKQNRKRSLASVDIFSEPVDRFEKSKRRWKLKRFCITCMELIFKFCFREFYSPFEFFLYFDFQIHETHRKALFSKICLLEIIVRPLISLMTNFKCLTCLASELEHVENDIHFCQDIWCTAT